MKKWNYSKVIYVQTLVPIIKKLNFSCVFPTINTISMIRKLIVNGKYPSAEGES